MPSVCENDTLGARWHRCGSGFLLHVEIGSNTWSGLGTITKMRIPEICAELEELAATGVQNRNTAEVCLQAASLLRMMRETILSGLPESTVVEQLEGMLVGQGQG